MSTVTTSWQQANDGQTTQLDLSNVLAIENAKIRWRGVRDDTNQVEEDTESKTTKDWCFFGPAYAYFPPAPTHGTLWYFLARARLKNEWHETVQFYNFQMYYPDGYEINSPQLDSGRSAWHSQPSSGNLVGEGISVDAEADKTVPDGTNDVMTITAIAQTWFRWETGDPKVTVNGQDTQYVGTLNDGVESDWQALSGLNAQEVNDILHAIAGSEEAEYQVQYDVIALPAPELHEPQDEHSTYDRYFAEFEFTLTEEPAIDGPYHAGITLQGTTYRSRTSQSRWEYWDGAAWQSFPSAGVDPGTRVKFTYDQSWSLGSHTWTAFSEGEIKGDWEESQPASRTLNINRLSAPVVVSPERNSRTEERQPWFTVDLTSETYTGADDYHARVRVSYYVGMSPLEMTLASDGGAGVWEYYNTTTPAWEAYPAGGVAPGTRVRARPSADMDYAVYYWDAASHDGLDWSEDIYPSPKIYIVLSVDAMYNLFIDGEAWDVYSLQVAETSNGELGEIVLEVNNEDGTAYSAIDYGDEVNIIVLDPYGNEADYKGLVRQKNLTDGHALQVVAIMGDGILAERLIDKNYINQEIWAIVKDIVDEYCDPLTSTNVSSGVDWQRPLPADGERPLRKLETLRRDYDIYYYVDDNWDFHLYQESDIASSTATVRYGGSETPGENDLFFLEAPTVDLKAPQATHVTVKCKDTGDSYTASLANILDSEKVEQLVEIDEGGLSVCTEVAGRLLDKWGKEQKSVTGNVNLTVVLEFKEKISIRIPEAGIVDSNVVSDDITKVEDWGVYYEIENVEEDTGDLVLIYGVIDKL